MKKGISFDDLSGKVCVITGGSGVLGSAMSEGLAALGVKTAILGRNEAKAKAVAEKISSETGTKVIGVRADVLDRSSLEEAKGIVVDSLGPVDFLINCAGGNAPGGTTAKEEMEKTDPMDFGGTFFSLDVDAFDSVLGLNFKGTLLPTMIFAREMAEKNRGVVLNVSSMSAYRPLTKVAAYSAAKAAVNSFTEWLAVHLAKTGVRVNAIAPGFFLTEQNRFLLTDEKTGELTPRGAKILNSTPMGRFGDPDDLVGTMAYLLSDASRFVTGAVIPIDGGFNAYSGV